jgi:hypothetical protein
MPSPQQTAAAENILSIFLAKMIRYAILWADCQAGKTGAFQELINLMLSSGIVQRVYILCGSSEIGLRDQAIQDTKKANSASYESGIIKVLFRQDFKGYTMDITNALIVVDESHLDQGQNQELDKFLGEHGLSMDGNPTKLNEKNAFIVSVDATPYAELAALKHKETPFNKHVETLLPGSNYFGLSDYLYKGLLKETYDISKNPGRFQMLLESNGRKWALVRLRNGKHASLEEAAIKAICESSGFPLLYYTEKKTEIAITRDEQIRLGASIPCLENAPQKPTVVIIRDRLRAGKVVPKKHISFVWEGAKKSKTDALVQGLPGRMCGYEFGEIKPLIFVPASALKMRKDKIIKASEMARASMGPIVMPLNGTNLKVSKLPNVSTKERLTPLRLSWPTEDRGDEEAERGEYCRIILQQNKKLIEDHTSYTNEQKKEILNFLETATPHVNKMDATTSDAYISFFKNVLEAHRNGTTVSHSHEDEMTFVVLKKTCKKALAIPGANTNHFFVIFHTVAKSGVKSIMSVDLKARIPQTTGKSIFSLHDCQTAKPIAAGGIVGFDESKLKTPALLEKAIRDYVNLWKSSSLTAARCIQSNKDRFCLNKRVFNWTAAKKNDVEIICAKLGKEFGVKITVSYTRSGGDTFNIKTISW